MHITLTVWNRWSQIIWGTVLKKCGGLISEDKSAWFDFLLGFERFATPMEECSLSTLSTPLYKSFQLWKSIRHTLYLKIIHIINNFRIFYGKMTNKICCGLRAYGWKSYSWPEVIHASKIFWNPPHNFYHKNPNSSLWNVSSLKKFSFKYKMGSKGSKGDGGQIA